MRHRRTLFVTPLLIVIIFAGGERSEARQKLDAIVLVVADGTSLELITAARNYALGAAGRLALEDFPNTAFVRTYSASDMVTDSGASATAMSRGIKADNRVDRNGRPCRIVQPAEYPRFGQEGRMVYGRGHRRFRHRCDTRALPRRARQSRSARDHRCKDPGAARWSSRHRSWRRIEMVLRPRE